MGIAGKLQSHPLFATFSPDALSQAARATLAEAPAAFLTAAKRLYADQAIDRRVSAALGAARGRIIKALIALHQP